MFPDLQVVPPSQEGSKTIWSHLFMVEKGGCTLENLLVVTDWIVYHALVPLFLDFGWASIQTGGEWWLWRRDPSIKHGREGKAEDCLDVKETINQDSVLYHKFLYRIILPLGRLWVVSHGCDHRSSLLVIAAQSSALKPDVTHITVTMGQEHNK